MPKKNTRNTKGRIISAAWKLFYENGYDATTIEDIIYASGTSRGSFYHYFEGKDALLGTLAYVFDEKYEELRKTLDPEWDAADKVGSSVHTAAGPGREASAGSQQNILPYTAGDHYGRSKERRDPQRLHSKRGHQGLCDVGESAYVRLVPLRGRLFPGRIRG